MFRLLTIILVLSCSLYQAQILNAYARVNNVSGTTLSLSNVNESFHTFNTGEKILIMQMQDDVIGTNTVSTSSTFGDVGAIANAGVYEFGIISSRSPATGTPTTITLATALVNAYNTGANSSVQIVTFRNMGANYTTSANIAGLPWDGNVGGIICFEVGNTLTLQNNISADGIGFLGGIRNPNFYSACDNSTYAAPIGNRYSGKGEGIYNTTSNSFEGARGKLLNGGGGGNDVNGGGAGGGNYSLGGDGGIGWVPAGTGCVPTVGGVGGLGLNAYISATRVFMGGGGGAGHQNDGVGSAGGNGGGIIMIKAMQLISGSCSGISITANGLSAANASNDGAGGGGAAGSIILQIPTYNTTGSCPLVIGANGGNGGSSQTSGVHGGGAGGGQGTIVFSSTQPTVNVTTGTAPGTGGTSCSGCPVSSNPTNGGGPNNAGIISSSSGPLPIELLNFNGELLANRVRLFWSTTTELNNDYYHVERSDDAIHYKNIGTISATGNTRILSHYELFDENPLDGVNYYRLKRIDANGTFSYSNIMAFSFTHDVSFNLFPNPAGTGESVYITMNRSTSSSIEIVVYDITGKPVAFQQMSVNNDKPMELSDFSLAKGMYMVRVQTGNNSEIKKLIIN